MPFWYGGMWIMPLLMPIIVGGVVYFLYKNGVFNGMCGPMQNRDWQDDNQLKQQERDLTPLEILKRRYAEGELTTEEYKERKKELKSD